MTTDNFDLMSALLRPGLIPGVTQEDIKAAGQSPERPELPEPTGPQVGDVRQGHVWTGDRWKPTGVSPGALPTPPLGLLGAGTLPLPTLQTRPVSAARGQPQQDSQQPMGGTDVREQVLESLRSLLGDSVVDLLRRFLERMAGSQQAPQGRSAASLPPTVPWTWRR